MKGDIYRAIAPLEHEGYTVIHPKAYRDPVKEQNILRLFAEINLNAGYIACCDELVDLKRTESKEAKE